MLMVIFMELSSKRNESDGKLKFCNGIDANIISSCYDHLDIVCAIRSIFGFLKNSLNEEIRKHDFLPLTYEQDNEEKINATSFISASIRKNSDGIISKKIIVPENFYKENSSHHSPADSMMVASFLFEVLPAEITSSAAKMINDNKISVYTPKGLRENNKTIAVSALSCAIVASCLSDNYFEHALSHMLMDHKTDSHDKSIKNEIMRLSARSMVRELSNCNIIDGHCENLNFIFDSMVSSLAYNPNNGCINLMNIFDDFQSFISKENAMFHIKAFSGVSFECINNSGRCSDFSYQ